MLGAGAAKTTVSALGLEGNVSITVNVSTASMGKRGLLSSSRRRVLGEGATVRNPIASKIIVNAILEELYALQNAIAWAARMV